MPYGKIIHLFTYFSTKIAYIFVDTLVYIFIYKFVYIFIYIFVFIFIKIVHFFVYRITKAQLAYNDAFASVKYTEFKDMAKNAAFNASHFLTASINEIWSRNLENCIGTDGKPKILQNFKMPFECLCMVDNLVDMNKGIVAWAENDEKIAIVYNKRTTELSMDVLFYSWKYFLVML